MIKGKNKKLKKYKLLLLLLWMFFTAIMLATTSYAWFTANRVVYIDSLNVRVRAESGLEISADGSNWGAILSNEDIINAHDGLYSTSVNQIPTEMVPVSSGKEVDNTTGFLKMYYGSVTNNSSGNYILTATRNIEEEGSGETSTGKFIAFDIFLKTSQTQNLYLSNESGATYTGIDSKGTENSVRFAFLIEGNTSSDSALGTIQGLSNATNTSTYIWEPNYDVHTESGVNNAKNVYNKNTSLTGGEILSYDGVISDIGASALIDIKNATADNYPNIFKTVDVDYVTRRDFATNQEIFTINSGITKVRIYIWLEGQDVDCENNAAVGDISFNLQLTVNPN